ncbi:MAG: hypothetical protein A2W00_03675 [Candidatus Eisenbacteria bacterium RBG_16_71_46]|nr:MAG: hypothetical protein A2W00_03675 [Candidatus Eisenbacteria bacterium RBG_16_71_46]
MLLDILEEHLEETEILWSSRRITMRSPNLDLRGLAALEARLSAHLEGLALGARESRESLEAALTGCDTDRAFAAAAALLTTRDPGARQGVRQALAVSLPPARRGITEALCHMPLKDDTRAALEIQLERSAGLDPAAIEVLSFHRCLPDGNLALAVPGGDRETRRAAARAIGRMGGRADWAQWLVGDDDQAVRDLALQAAARCGLPWAHRKLRLVCGDGERVSPESLRLLACLGDRSDIELLRTCAHRHELGDAAVAGLGTLGYTGCVDALMEVVGDARLARAAGRAFKRITGLEPPVIAEQSSGLEIEDATFEDLRPIPDAGATRALWRERRAGFDAHIRWRDGEPLETGRWKQAPYLGDLLTRREELTRLWMQEPALFPKLELDAPVARQRAVTA